MDSLAPPIITDAPATASDPSSPPPPVAISQQPSNAPARRTIIIGCDENETAKRSIAWVLSNVATANDKILLLRAIPAPAVFYPSVGLVPPPMFDLPTGIEELEIQHKNEAKAMDQIIATLIPAIEEMKVPYEIDVISASGYDWNVTAVANILCQRAKEAKASLIVVSKHNKGFLKEMFTGSVTAKLIHLSSVPVLVFHDEA